jgi:hypothetical protein
MGLGVKILIKTIPHETQRYDTVGDWYENESAGLHIRVSETGNDDYNFLIALHELVEYYLCKKRGVKESDVDEFDMGFTGSGEPGDDKAAPYYDEHQTATLVEKAMAETLGIDWNLYGKVVDAM